MNGKSIPFHERLVSYRKLVGVSRRQLAEKSDIPYTTLSDYETGKVEPSARAFYRLADALLIRPRWLLEGEEPSVSLTNSEYGPEFVYLPFEDPAKLTNQRLVKNLKVLLRELERRKIKMSDH